jgi:N-acetylmuramoyl-L-alanine amidase
MPLQHKVKQGECMASIADKYGFCPDMLWRHGKNAAIRKQRENINILYPGDLVFIPDKQTRTQDAATEQRHRFRKKIGPVKLRLRLLHHGNPIADEAYILKVEDRVISGNTDPDGYLEEIIPSGTGSAELALGEENPEILLLEIGSLDPVTEISGVQARLNNLGFDCGIVDGVSGPLTRGGVSAFQETNELEVTGDPDSPTRDELIERYGA